MGVGARGVVRERGAGRGGVGARHGFVGGHRAAAGALETPAEHGIPGLLQLFGIESPGLTATLALADLVAGALA